MTPWLAIVGLMEDGLEGLKPAARTLVEGAEVLVGGRRHLALVPSGRGVERLTWARPLSATLDAIAARRGRRVCVLATGDPMCYGIGVSLVRRFPIEEMTILPAPSAFSLACARLGWPLMEVEALTLHGRSLDLVRRYLAPAARLLILAHDGESPAKVAALLREAGYGSSPIIVYAHMGAEAERRAEGTAEAWPTERLPDFNTIAVECRAAPGASVLPRTPGLPDEAFQNDGQLTKREVRAVTLAALAPLPGALLWDVGAGSGAVAIEWLRAARGTKAVAVEREQARTAMIAHNAGALGVPELEIVTGTAPKALEGLPTPDAVFIGGGLAEPGMLETCWSALRPGGRLVANAVTLEGERTLLAWQTRVEGTLTRLSVARTEPMGSFTGWRAMSPVSQLAAAKP
ncbi:MAG: precorrin-6y C5,15-methyltransferase (decarboxylating) subunit CbiE [Alphaproteobacteria bacterium]